MNNELESMWKEVAVTWFEMFGICQEGLSKMKKDLSQDIRSPCQDLNPGPPEYEAEMRRSVI
jgi:hypothetical protein